MFWFEGQYVYRNECFKYLTQKIFTVASTVMLCSWTDFYLFLYTKKSIMESKHKRPLQVRKNISLIKKNLVIHNNTATIIVQYS